MVIAVELGYHGKRRSPDLAQYARLNKPEHALVAKWVLLGDWNLIAVFLEAAVERLILQSVIARRKW